FGAKFKPDAGFGRARLKGVSTGADDRAFHVFGMDSWPHKCVIVLINEGIVRPAGLIPYLVMEVRTRRNAGGSHETQQRARLHRLPSMNRYSGERTLAGVHARPRVVDGLEPRHIAVSPDPSRRP